MCYCVILSARYARSQFYCTVDLNILKWLIMFSYFFPILAMNDCNTSLFFLNVSVSDGGA
jgi:hypothetical protein